MLNNKTKKNYISSSHLKSNVKNIVSKPDWIKVKAPISPGYLSTKALISKANLNTVCPSTALCSKLIKWFGKRELKVGGK